MLQWVLKDPYLDLFYFLYLTINDLPTYIKTHTVLYTDNTTFLNHSNDFKGLKILFDGTISRASWLKANKLLLNESKTQEVIFCLRNRLPPDDSVNIKFLGVYIVHKLTWRSTLVI